jgi:uncharacterized membrane protein
MSFIILGLAWALGIAGILLARTLAPRKVLVALGIALLLVVYAVDLSTGPVIPKPPVYIEEGAL